MEKEKQEILKKDRKPYQKPEIIHEFELETRAGSTIPPGQSEFDDYDLNFPEP